MGFRSYSFVLPITQAGGPNTLIALKCREKLVFFAYRIEKVQMKTERVQPLTAERKWISQLWAVGFTLAIGAAMLAIAITSAH